MSFFPEEGEPKSTNVAVSEELCSAARILTSRMQEIDRGGDQTDQDDRSYCKIVCEPSMIGARRGDSSYCCARIDDEHSMHLEGVKSAIVGVCAWVCHDSKRECRGRGNGPSLSTSN